jgi:type VI secretion system protein ImpB
MAQGFAGSRSDRIQAPRVHITYETENGDSTELPFVIGVLGDFSGKPDGPRQRLRDRQFVEINRDNFDTVVRMMKPRLDFQVDNKLTDEASRIAVELRFEQLEDFEPEPVAKQIEPLRRLVELRQELASLRRLLRRDGLLGERLRTAVRERAARHGAGPRDGRP